LKKPPPPPPSATAVKGGSTSHAETPSLNKLCPPGLVIDKAINACTTCRDGFVPDRQTQSQCAQCMRGTYALTGDAHCHDCPTSFSTFLQILANSTMENREQRRVLSETYNRIMAMCPKFNPDGNGGGSGGGGGQQSTAPAAALAIVAVGGKSAVAPPPAKAPTSTISTISHHKNGPGSQQHYLQQQQHEQQHRNLQSRRRLRGSDTVGGGSNSVKNAPTQAKSPSITSSGTNAPTTNTANVVVPPPIGTGTGTATGSIRPTCNPSQMTSQLQQQLQHQHGGNILCPPYPAVCSFRLCNDAVMRSAPQALLISTHNKSSCNNPPRRQFTILLFSDAAMDPNVPIFTDDHFDCTRGRSLDLSTTIPKSANGPVSGGAHAHSCTDNNNGKNNWKLTNGGDPADCIECTEFTLLQSCGTATTCNVRLEVTTSSSHIMPLGTTQMAVSL
jgi:hypothetical protein